MKTIQALFMSGLFIASGMAAVHAAGDAKAGESTFLSKGCVGCHGPAGNSPAPEMFPKLSGLEETYISDTLKAFRSGEKTGTTMNAMASALTDDDIANLAAYLSAQK
jgi:cytochrome c553